MKLHTSRSLNAEGAVRHIVGWMVDYLDQSGLDGWVVGVSGGIDSAVTSTLAALTGRPTTLLRMPIHQAVDQDQRGADHIAQLEAAHGHVSSCVVDLTSSFDGLSSALSASAGGPFGGLSLANARARLRMTTLYAVAAERRALVAGTGNQVEDFGVGFYTKYGDGGVDLSPIADLLKSEVYAVGRVLGIGEAILKAAPTDGLWGDDRTDEDQLGARYDELEWAMEQVSLGRDAAGYDAGSRESEVMQIYAKHHRANRHKMDPIPVCVMPAGLFGLEQQ
ncbi:NAD(+) synthase [Flavobacteriales bacterium]|nr:NAD(+) synthase [Flavobacteriales bacterium]